MLLAPPIPRRQRLVQLAVLMVILLALRARKHEENTSRANQFWSEPTQLLSQYEQSEMHFDNTVNREENLFSKSEDFVNHRSLTAASAANSVVSGSGIFDIASGTTVIITVNAKDSSGASINTGGELFVVRISNTCSKYNEHYCQPNGNSNTLSSNVIEPMTDHNNGTYSYSYSVSTTGPISVQVLLLTQGKVYHEYYSGQTLSGAPIKNCTVNGVNFNKNDQTNFCGPVTDNISAKIIFFLKSPYSGTINMKVRYDDGFGLWVNDAVKFEPVCGSGNVQNNFDLNLVKGQLYSFYSEWCQGCCGFYYALDMNYPGFSNSEISSSDLFLQKLVGACSSIIISLISPKKSMKIQFYIYLNIYILYPQK